MLITQGTLSHICEFDCAFRACIHEPIATLRMKFGSGDNLCKFFHIGRLDVDDVEALILYIEVPKVYPEVITANECFSITVDGDAVDVISMCICICPAGHSSDNCIMVGHAREFKL